MAFTAAWEMAMDIQEVNPPSSSEDDYPPENKNSDIQNHNSPPIPSGIESESENSNNNSDWTVNLDEQSEEPNSYGFTWNTHCPIILAIMKIKMIILKDGNGIVFQMKKILDQKTVLRKTAYSFWLQAKSTFFLSSTT